MNDSIETLKYPIGRFKVPEKIDQELLENWIEIIQNFPVKLKQEVVNLSNEDLGKRYRPNGWTIKQVIHHCADSHINSFIRFKLTLTEDTPTIKPYFENLWAEFPDSKTLSIESSIKIIEGLHVRWINLLKNLSETEFEKQFIHPDTNEYISLKLNTGIYAWHCEHHLAHIKNAKQS